MKRVLLTNLGILVIAGIALLFYRQHKNVQNTELREEMVPDLISKIRYGDLDQRTYTGKATRLWLDRDYTTEQDVVGLIGKHFVFLPRNSDHIYSLIVEAKTEVFTIANSDDRASTKLDWQEVDEQVMVQDVYTRRSFDLLLKRTLEVGTYSIRPTPGGPQQPVFFDPAVVGVAAGFIQ